MKTKRPKRLSGLREGQLTDMAEAIDRLNNRVRTLECLQAPKTLQALEGRINELETQVAEHELQAPTALRNRIAALEARPIVIGLDARLDKIELRLTQLEAASANHNGQLFELRQRRTVLRTPPDRLEEMTCSNCECFFPRQELRQCPGIGLVCWKCYRNRAECYEENEALKLWFNLKCP